MHTVFTRIRQQYYHLNTPAPWPWANKHPHHSIWGQTSKSSHFNNAVYMTIYKSPVILQSAFNCWQQHMLQNIGYLAISIRIRDKCWHINAKRIKLLGHVYHSTRLNWSNQSQNKIAAVLIWPDNLLHFSYGEGGMQPIVLIILKDELLSHVNSFRAWYNTSSLVM